jgi:hypothetical protein
MVVDLQLQCRVQLHGGVESVCYAKQLRCARRRRLLTATTLRLNVSTMQAASGQPDVFLVTSDKGDTCKMIPTVKYHHPVLYQAKGPLASAQSPLPDFEQVSTAF